MAASIGRMTSAAWRLLAVAVLLAVVLPASASAELRGLWVVRTALVSPESVDRAVDEGGSQPRDEDHQGYVELVVV